MTLSGNAKVQHQAIIHRNKGYEKFLFQSRTIKITLKLSLYISY